MSEEQNGATPEVWTVKCEERNGPPVVHHLALTKHKAKPGDYFTDTYWHAATSDAKGVFDGNGTAVDQTPRRAIQTIARLSQWEVMEIRGPHDHNLDADVFRMCEEAARDVQRMFEFGENVRANGVKYTAEECALIAEGAELVVAQIRSLQRGPATD